MGYQGLSGYELCHLRCRRGAGGGFKPVSDEYPAGTMMIYINTPNLTETLEKIKAVGGTIIMDEYDIPIVSKIVIFKDPTGNENSLLQRLVE